jgi:hypothetical protein
MSTHKNLFFIPIIARAFQSSDPSRSMEEAFEEIDELGKREEYREGFEQFMEFIKTVMNPSDKTTPHRRVELLKATIHRLVHDLATDTFEGDEEQKKTLIAALREFPEWNAEYLRMQEEVRGPLAFQYHLEIEVVRENHLLGSFPLPSNPDAFVKVTPGKYTVRFSNGRVLWEGELRREELIWAYAFPGKDLALAAETEVSWIRPTRKISMLGGEIVFSVYAGLETGQIRVESGKTD